MDTQNQHTEVDIHAHAQTPSCLRGRRESTESREGGRRERKEEEEDGRPVHRHRQISTRTHPYREREREALGSRLSRPRPLCPITTRLPGVSYLSLASLSRNSLSISFSIRCLIRAGDGRKRRARCLVTSTKRSLWSILFLIFMILTIAASTLQKRKICQNSSDRKKKRKPMPSKRHPKTRYVSIYDLRPRQ